MEPRPGETAEPVPAVLRPGWVYENGDWRRKTPAERARPEHQPMAASDERENIGSDLGMEPGDDAPPAPFEPGGFTDKDGKLEPAEIDDAREQSDDNGSQPRIEWKKQPEPPISSDQRSPTYRTKGPIKVERWSEALGVDGVRYKVRWYPLNEQGKREEIVVDPDNFGKEYGGHTGATGLLKDVFGVEPPSDVIQPPYENSNGWEVEIETPSQAAAHGNARDVELRVYLPEEE